jgi:hypothetical protein
VEAPIVRRLLYCEIFVYRKTDLNILIRVIIDRITLVIKQGSLK